MEIKDLPLRELFYKLRAAGLVLGIDEYQLLLKALMAGFGLNDREALRRLCKTLWVKSLEQEKIFDRYFDQFITQKIINPIVAPEARSTSEPIPQRPIDETFPDPMPNLAQPEVSPRDQESIASSPELGEEMLEDGNDYGDDYGNDYGNDDFALGMEDETQAPKPGTNKLYADKPEDTDWADYLLLDDYLPVTVRQAQQSWRYLRRNVREGALTELDVAGTIAQIAQQGFFLNPVMVPQRVNRSQLILLLDIDGSMVAFHSLGERLKETLRFGGLERSQVYYFHNCPVDYLYGDPGQSDYQTIEQVLAQASPNHTSVLIFSDAGAARGGYSEDRLEWTQIFLQQLQQRIRYVAWLNPVPQKVNSDHRWAGTTAGEIAKLVPMFEGDRSGLQQAMKVLQGNLMRN